jgi:6-phosphogluconolactonase
MASVLIGTYTDSLPHVQGIGSGIHGAAWVDGTLAPVRLLASTPNPSYLAVSSGGTSVYAVDEVGGRLSAFTGDFRPLGSVPMEGVAPCHVALSPDERFVLVAHWGSGSVSVHERRADGSLGATTANVQHGDGARAHMVCPDPVDGSLLVPDLGMDAVFGYRLSSDGLLEESFRLALPPKTGPRHIAFSESGAHLYVVGEVASSVITFERMPQRWCAVGSVSTLPAGTSAANTAAAIRVHGDRMFVSNRGHDSVAMFALDPLPTLLGHASVHGRTPRDLVVLPDGPHLLTANQDSNDLALLAIERDRLHYVSSIPAPSPVCLVVTA